MRYEDLCESDQKAVLEMLGHLGVPHEEIEKFTVGIDKAKPGSDKSVSMHFCGPSTLKCKCNCPDSCEHDFTGEWIYETTEGDSEWGSTTCVKCGMTSMDHDMCVCP